MDAPQRERSDPEARHCERSEAIQSDVSQWIASPLSLLAMTALTFVAPAGTARAADQSWHCMQTGAVGSYELRSDALVLRDIRLTEEAGELSHLAVIKASFVAHNKSSKDFHVAMEILGSDDKGPVFAMSVAPAFAGTVSPNSDQPATSTIFAAPGEFARAVQICVRFVGDF
jgi:hypothetical protein